jgi:3-hydroxybutyryl-CoA dehydrogenase
MQPADVDECMTLGAGHPMGPLKLLDLVGLDVSLAIGEELHSESGNASHDPPRLLRALVADGKLGRKSGAGFYEY